MKNFIKRAIGRIRRKPLLVNGSRLEAVANFGNVNFRLLLNFLRKINVN